MEKQAPPLENLALAASKSSSNAEIIKEIGRSQRIKTNCGVTIVKNKDTLEILARNFMGRLLLAISGPEDPEEKREISK